MLSQTEVKRSCHIRMSISIVIVLLTTGMLWGQQGPPRPSGADFLEFFKTCDKNGDGKITAEEFAELLLGMQDVDKSGTITKEEALEPFITRFDIDGDGVLTRDELLEAGKEGISNLDAD